MKNLNKVLAMLVVFMMVVSTVAFASFTDVADTSSYATAIDVDVDLGIIKGYDDNTFRPEGEITRAEFAAIVVRLLGQEAQSAGAAASTQFADVPSNHWAAGYINIAVQAGVINGYGNGNFGPDDLVEYQDALTMMVRALGYEPAIGSAGYPTGYLTKAGDLGLTKNVSGTNGVAANRGTVAQIAFNALDVPLMTQSGYGTFTQYVINDGYSSTTGNYNIKKTLLSENHSTVKVQGVILSSTDATSSSVTGTDKVEVSITNDLYNKFGISGHVNMEVGASDALAFVGKKCVLFVEYDEFEDVCTVKALYEVKSNDGIVIDLGDVEDYTAPVANIYNADGSIKTAGKAGLVKTEDFDYSIDPDATIYYNGIEIGNVTSAKPTTTTEIAKLLKKSGSIELALLDATNASADYDTIYITAYDVVVVKEVRPGATRVVAKTASDSQLNRISYNEENGDVKATLLDAEGKVMDWADLEENDVVIVKYVKSAKAIYEAQVANNTVTGTVTEIDAYDWANKNSSASAYKYVWIDDVEYKVLPCAEAEKDIKVGDEGTYYVTASGIVYHEASISVNTNYAYVISAQDESGMDGARMKMVTKDGIATYDVASKIYVTDMNINSNGKYERSTNKLAVNGTTYSIAGLTNTLITFKTDANGVVTAIELPLDYTVSANQSAYDAEDYFTVHTGSTTLSNYDPDDATFTGGYTLTEDTVVIDATAADSADWEVVALKNLAEGDKLAGATVYNVDDDDYVGAIVVTDPSNTVISGATNAATFVTGASEAYDEDGVLVTYVKGYVNGEEVVYESDVALTTAQGYVGKLYIPDYKANGDVKSFTAVDDGYSKGTPGASNYAVGFDGKATYSSSTGYSGDLTAQDSAKSRITINSAVEKIPASANVYVYEASSTKRVKYTTDAYIGYVEYDDPAKGGTWGWYIDEDNKNLTVTVYMYEYDGDIVDVVYYVH